MEGRASEPVANLGRAHGNDRAVKGWIVGKKELAAHEPSKRFVIAGVIAGLARTFGQMRAIRACCRLAARAQGFVLKPRPDIVAIDVDHVPRAGPAPNRLKLCPDMFAKAKIMRALAIGQFVAPWFEPNLLCFVACNVAWSTFKRQTVLPYPCRLL